MSLAFDGNIANNLDLVTGRDYLRNVGAGTIMAWVTLDVLGTSRAIIGFFGATGTTRAKISTLAGNTIQLRANALDADPTSAFNTVTTLTTGTRFHICGVFDFTNKTGLIYINGVLDTTAAFTNMTAGNTSNTAASDGSIGVNETGTANPWDGEIEDVRIYTRALTANEIQTIFTTKIIDGSVNSRQAQWQLNEQAIGANPATVPDISGSGFTLTRFGTLAYAEGVSNRRKRIA